MHPEPGEPANPNLRPLLRFVRRPAFAAVPPGRLVVWHWLFVTLLVGILMSIAYGLVVLQRVVRLRW